MEHLTIDTAFELIVKTFRLQQEAVLTRRKENLEVRKERLESIRKWVKRNRTRIQEAAYADFKKNATEVDLIEVLHVLDEIKVAVNNLELWARPMKVDATLTMLGTRSEIRNEPKGVCLIIAPWNYPFSLTIGPLVSALAAGNTAILKPSEMTPNVAALIQQMIEELFRPDEVFVCVGGPDVSKYLLSLPFDHIFFTGSPAVGKEVMAAAARNLTSVTLELGGKSPTIVTRSANLRSAAERTALAKWINNGQTCIAPDYVLVESAVRDEFIREVSAAAKRLFAPDSEFASSASYCRMVNSRHYGSVQELIADALQHGARIVSGGKSDAKDRFIEPVVMDNVPLESRMMQEEIFGPVLPICTFERLSEAIAVINGKPKPLALYIFSNKRSEQEEVLQSTSAGGTCINDAALHFMHHRLPFGGVNNSGIGKSHGKFGFEAFSNQKPVLRQRTGLTSARALYPPYTGFSRKIMDWFLKLF